MSDFFMMGGYGLYVWTAYGVSAVVLIGGAIVTLRTLRARQNELTHLSAQRHTNQSHPINTGTNPSPLNPTDVTIPVSTTDNNKVP